MKRFALFLATLPALVAVEPVFATNLLRLAVFDFESAPGTNPTLGPAVSRVLRTDISLLPPLAAVDCDQMGPSTGAGDLGYSEPVSPGAAASFGRRAGAAALVTGRITKSGLDVIIAARVVDSETGVAYGTIVHGQSSTTFADLVSELAVKIAAIVTRQRDLQAARIWSPAAIHGTQMKSGWSIFGRSETACVSAIDGRPISHETAIWNRDLSLTPGRHLISVLYSQGESAATALLVCDARPGGRYEVRSKSDSEKRVKLWIEDFAAGRPATRVATAAMVGAPPPSIIIDTRMLPP